MSAQAEVVAPADAGFEERRDAAAVHFIVDIEGYEGPLDLLLAMARDQKVDLRRISILALADQYLAFIAHACRAHIVLAAEYLVMAAWLAYLKSRLLLPEPPGADEPSADALAAALAARLRRLDAMRVAGARLFERPQLGQAFFARGCPERRPTPKPVAAKADLSDLISAYACVLKRRQTEQPLRIEAMEPLMTVEDALARIRRGLGHAPGWESLARYLPEETLAGLRAGRLVARAQLAATFLASLELARQGVLILRQGRPFGPIYIRAADAAEGAQP